ncbi:haloacid dehalogenase type II [Legionella longbeachae]|uniref:haloacid dehalogenase type II n=1 Tax=Legionella longbeachae TaxID=450 RepID=UPI001243C3D8|nr:haloacid dehalogenase type II [Legionella longbeachae]QEY52127.1 haloacid dehalogenase type II [Legionella longbeachae]
MTKAEVHLDKKLLSIRAMVFDVQGTCADFYQPLSRMGESVNRMKQLSIDWSLISREWRMLYRNILDAIIQGKRPWKRVDRIYREALDILLNEQGLSTYFTAQERDELNTIWVKLAPWPDSIEGLERLRQKFVTSTLSNAGMVALVSITKNAKLPFDVILSAELIQKYKPDPAVYQLAVDYLGFNPGEIMMVACHKYDLHAAKAFGMKTAFISRPWELGPNSKPDISPDNQFDLNVDSFTTLADKLVGEPLMPSSAF